MIYELWLWKNHQAANAAYAKITEEEEKALDEVFNDAAMERYGAQWELYCDSAWANEEYQNWGITSYKSIEAHIEHTQAIKRSGWYRFADMFSLLGTLDMQEGVPRKPDFPNPIYHLWISRTNPVTTTNYESLTEKEETALWARWQESVDRVNACMVLYCISGWCNEEYRDFGVMAFPSIEARQQHWDDLEMLNWCLYYTPITLLGVPV